MNAIHIVGLGSPHGADRAGWLAIDFLERSKFADSLPPGALCFHRCAGSHELPAALVGCRLGIVLDACDLPVGTIREIDPSELRACANPISGHALSLVRVLELMRVLAGAPGRVHLIGIGFGAATGDADLPFLPDGVAPALRDLLRSLLGLSPV